MLHMTSTKKRKRGAQLPPEPWGRRMRRAREDYAGLSQDRAVDAISQVALVDATTIGRLERLEEPPTSPKRRRMAYLLCLVYGLDPEQFGLDDGDVPPGIRRLIDEGYLTVGEQATASSRCTVLRFERELVPAA